MHRLEQLGIEMLHVDIMDGNFVANYCLGTEFIPLLHRITKLPLDIHLMIQRPDQKLSFIPFESRDYVTIHAESTPHIQKTLAEIRRRGAKAGLALNPATPLDYCRWMLPDIDLLLVMTINPGFAGQKLVPQTLDKNTVRKGTVGAGWKYGPHRNGWECVFYQCGENAPCWNKYICSEGLPAYILRKEPWRRTIENFVAPLRRGGAHKMIYKGNPVSAGIAIGSALCTIPRF